MIKQNLSFLETRSISHVYPVEYKKEVGRHAR